MIGAGNPYSLDDEVSYQQWRTAKLLDYPRRPDELLVDMAGDLPSAAECRQISRVCKKANMAIYRLRHPDRGNKAFVHALGEQLGLTHLDGNLCADNDSITSLQVMDTGRQSGYIPYTNRPLSWHTDGYYNAPDRRIRAMLLHCVREAREGGENMLLDHEIAYIQLRDQNPAFIHALMQDDVLTIPPNIEGDEMIREARTGPVFSVDPQTGQLHMRYSARGRNVIWRDDDSTRNATAALTALLSDKNPYVIRHRMQPGDGIICNNVLHCRSGFIDDPAPEKNRLLFRARYFDRIIQTESTEQN
jgi:alpha-ketoglutarate-dependent taurine dioxygenase